MQVQSKAACFGGIVSKKYPRIPEYPSNSGTAGMRIDILVGLAA